MNEDLQITATMMSKFIEWNNKPDVDSMFLFSRQPSESMNFVDFQNEREKLELFKIWSIYMSPEGSVNCNLDNFFVYFEIPYIIENINSSFTKILHNLYMKIYELRVSNKTKFHLKLLFDEPRMKKKVEILEIMGK